MGKKRLPAIISKTIQHEIKEDLTDDKEIKDYMHVGKCECPHCGKEVNWRTEKINGERLSKCPLCQKEIIVSMFLEKKVIYSLTSAIKRVKIC